MVIDRKTNFDFGLLLIFRLNQIDFRVLFNKIDSICVLDWTLTKSQYLVNKNKNKTKQKKNKTKTNNQKSFDGC